MAADRASGCGSGAGDRDVFPRHDDGKGKGHESSQRGGELKSRFSFSVSQMEVMRARLGTKVPGPAGTIDQKHFTSLSSLCRVVASAADQRLRPGAATCMSRPVTSNISISSLAVDESVPAPDKITAFPVPFSLG